MGTTQGETFACPACKAQFAWRAQVAGRKVSCTCGQVFAAPVEAGGEGPQEMAVAGGMGRFRDPSRRSEPQEAEDEATGGWIKCYAVPITLLVVGLGIQCKQITWVRPELPMRIMIGPGMMVALLLVHVVTMLAGVFLAARVVDEGFGTVGTAVLKCVAIAVFASAMALPVARFDADAKSIWGPGVAWSIMVLCYWMLFASLFKLEIHETVLTVLVVAVAQAIAMYVVLM